MELPSRIFQAYAAGRRQRGCRRAPSAPSSGRDAVFMDHFDKRFQIAASSASGRIIAIAAAHHRLNYIHPFPDGNGRVSRLMSHAIALEAGIGGKGLWSSCAGWRED